MKSLLELDQFDLESASKQQVAEVVHALLEQVKNAAVEPEPEFQSIPRVAVLRSRYYASPNRRAAVVVLAAAKERVNLADKDDETRSNILVNKKGATWPLFY